MSEAEEANPTTESPHRRLTCMPCFDALWFCYCNFLSHTLPPLLHPFALDFLFPILQTHISTPVHQLQQYYRLGVLDNCFNKWSKLYDCLSLKTKSSSALQEILDAREKEKHHIWSFRTPEESAAKWYEWYGDLDEIQ